MGRSVLPATPVAFTAAPALAQAEQGPPDAAFEPARETQARALATAPAGMTSRDGSLFEGRAGGLLGGR